MGGAHVWNHADPAHIVLKVCALLHWCPHPFLVDMVQRLQTVQASFVCHLSRRHLPSCADTCSMSYLFRQPLLPMRRSTALWHQCVAHTLPCTGQSIRPWPHRLPAEYKLRRLQSYGATFMREHGGSHRNVNCRRNPELTGMARIVRSVVQDKSPKLRAAFCPFPHSHSGSRS